MMSHVATFGVGLFLCFVALITFKNWAALRTKRLAQGRDHLEKFERAALRLIKNDSTPEPIANFVAWLSSEAGKPQIAGWIAREILSGRLFKVPPAQTDRQRSMRRAMDSLDSAQLELIAECVAHCLMSSASAHPVLSSYLGRVLFFGLFDPQSRKVDDGDKARAIIVDFSAREDRYAKAERQFATA